MNCATEIRQSFTFLVVAAAAGWTLPAASLQSADPPATAANPDFTQGGRIPAGATHDWNLGPTGVRGWMYSNKMETSEARQICITHVDRDSPADGVLQPGDVLLGVAGRPFVDDPRTELGRAIGAAEAADGRLPLIRWRDGQQATVHVQLAALGAYSSTAPFNCSKSSRIFEQGCEALARQMRANPNQGNGIIRSLNALALLSSGKAEYLPLVREQVEWAAQFSDPDRRTYHSWFYGPINILLAEYTLATGDRSYLPQLKRITMEIVHGQSAVGSWGHRFVQANGRLAGYGMMNAPGLPLTVSLILARQAGIADPELDEAIAKSTLLLRFYVGKGSVPYGDHHPWIQTHDDNGKNGIAAVLFHLLGDREAAEYFSRMSVASHGSERDTGHTGNFFNMLWAMPGVALSGPHATGAWMQEFAWYYDLARRWDGTYQHQGPPAEKPDKYHRWDCTGAYLLAYAQPLRNIHLAGSQPSVARQVDRATADSLIADGRDWSPRRRIEAYAERSSEQILAGLRSWSPVVRERCAMELARRQGDATPQLIAMLQDADLHARLGACQALIMLQDRAAPAVPALRRTLQSEDLWLRIKAAEALASIGKAAMPVVPELLTMLASEDPQRDPRGMQQRYLCFALFNRREGMLGRSLDGVDRQALYEAVRAGLGNEDGRARGALGSVYRNLSFAEIAPLLPAIYQAVLEPAPSGIMFADEIRLSGLEILAQHHIQEGLPLCVSLIDPDRWGLANRIQRCLETLRLYGGAAKSEIPQLQQLEGKLAANGWKPDKIAELAIPALIEQIQMDQDPPALRSLTGLLSAQTAVTFLVTSDSHYDAFENEDRNERDRVTIDQMNAIASVRWPEELGGELIGPPRGVLLLGDVIDDGDRMLEGQNQGAQQNRYFLADFGFDGTEGRLRYPVFEGWGNHDGPPAGRERFGFSFQQQLKQRNDERLRRGLINHVSQNGLHYSWNWNGVHFVQLNLFPADQPHPEIRYSPQYHDPQDALAFLKADLSEHLDAPLQPVVLTHHYDLQGTDWWHAEQRKAYYDLVRSYNIVAVFHGHTGTGVYQWKPEGDPREALHVVNTGQTENGFFVVQITADRIRLAYRAKTNVQLIRQPDQTQRREWDGSWGWRFTHHREFQ